MSEMRAMLIISQILGIRTPFPKAGPEFEVSSGNRILSLDQIDLDLKKSGET